MTDRTLPNRHSATGSIAELDQKDSSEVGGAVGGMDYTAVAMAIRRFETRAENAPYLSQLMQAVKMNVKVTAKD